MTLPEQVADDSATAAAMRRSRFDALLREGSRDLTPEELRAVLGPRGRTGDPANKLRGARIRSLNVFGFTCEGRKIERGR